MDPKIQIPDVKATVEIEPWIGNQQAIINRLSETGKRILAEIINDFLENNKLKEKINEKIEELEKHFLERNYSKEEINKTVKVAIDFGPIHNKYLVVKEIRIEVGTIYGSLKHYFNIARDIILIDAYYTKEINERNSILLNEILQINKILYLEYELERLRAELERLKNKEEENEEDEEEEE